MLAIGDRIPAATVWLGPRDQVSLDDLASDGPVLVLFYLFDWSAT